MQRHRLTYLEQWLTSASRKPLLIRGARQVGKTWLVRYLAEKQNRQLVELNFEKNSELLSLFKENNPITITKNLASVLKISIDPAQALLFLDEIQAAPELIAKLRWFAEDMPALPVIAAGSLLEFILAQPTFSVPVGRISMCHLEPLSFEEFLLAMNEDGLLDYIRSYRFPAEIPGIMHTRLLRLFKEYIIIGGLPAAVKSWAEQHELIPVHQIHQDLVATYRADFARYRGRLASDRLEEVMAAIPQKLGEKIVYAKINSSVQAAAIKQAIDLLAKGRIIHHVHACAGNGVPLAAERLEKYLKLIFIDVGLCSAALGLRLTDLVNIEEINLVNQGGIAEQVVGQLLRTIDPPFIEPSLYYWTREEKGANAEIDYLIQHGPEVLPLEVKAGAVGSLKSLHLFMAAKKLSRAVRINSDKPSLHPINVLTTSKHSATYTLLSLPFYLLEQLPRILSELDIDLKKKNLG
jgi:predicted AAA+ superfamily ATPase